MAMFVDKNHPPQDVPSGAKKPARADLSGYQILNDASTDMLLPTASHEFAERTRSDLPQLEIAPGKSDLWAGRSNVQEVISGVCITNFFGARNKSLLNDYGITHVVVCAGELPKIFPHSFKYLKLEGFTDNTGTELAPLLDVALPWMDQAIYEGGRILLHCASGTSRSGAVLTAYLMRHLAISSSDALKLARSARPIIQPNPGFLEQLETY